MAVPLRWRMRRPWHCACVTRNHGWVSQIVLVLSCVNANRLLSVPGRPGPASARGEAREKSKICWNVSLLSLKNVSRVIDHLVPKWRWAFREPLDFYKRSINVVWDIFRAKTSFQREHGAREGYFFVPRKSWWIFWQFLMQIPIPVTSGPGRIVFFFLFFFSYE